MDRNPALEDLLIGRRHGKRRGVKKMKVIAPEGVKSTKRGQAYGKGKKNPQGQILHPVLAGRLSWEAYFITFPKDLSGVAWMNSFSGSMAEIH